MMRRLGLLFFIGAPFVFGVFVFDDVSLTVFILA